MRYGLFHPQLEDFAIMGTAPWCDDTTYGQGSNPKQTFEKENPRLIRGDGATFPMVRDPDTNMFYSNVTFEKLNSAERTARLEKLFNDDAAKR